MTSVSSLTPRRLLAGLALVAVLSTVAPAAAETRMLVALILTNLVPGIVLRPVGGLS